MAVAGGARAAEKAPLQVAPVLAPGEEAANEILAPLNFGEAPQSGILGDTGTGKTTAAQRIVNRRLELAPGIVLVVDDKERRARFKGQERRDVADLVARRWDPAGPRVIVFRGDVVAGVSADPEEVAELAWRRAAKGRASYVVHDELIAGREDVVKNRQWRKGITYIPRSFTKGRAAGVGDLWGAQSPQDVPIEPFEQSNAILCFKLAGLGLERLRERNYLHGVGDVGLKIEKLPGMERPPNERGAFVLLVRGQPWNGKIYRFAIASS
jgi:hypothetical protein